MSRLKNPKRKTQKYFDLRQISDLGVTGQSFLPFVSAYANHVLYRAKTFTGRLEVG